MDSDDRKITQLTQVTSLSDSDLFVVSVDVGTAPKTRAIKKSDAIVGGGGAETVKNTSGGTAAANDVGYINAAGEYKTTTTASLNAAWAIVLTGGANNADITVVRRGRATVNYTGTAPATGDYLITSTVAGSALKQTTMSPEIFAVCLAAGSGGTVLVTLLTQTTYIPYQSTNDVYRADNHSVSLFVATINGAPSATSVVYNAPSSGDENIGPLATTQLAKMRLYNSTRGTYRLITAFNTGTNTITTVSSSDAWANGDTITIKDNTISDPYSPNVASFDLSQQSEIPVLARAIVLNVLHQDSGGAGQIVQFHPYEAASDAKLSNIVSTQSTSQNFGLAIQKLVDRKFGSRLGASGTGTALTIIKIIGWFEAQP